MRELTQYRLDRATEFLLAAKIMLENNFFKDSINRSYYAIFTTIRALLVENEIDFKKHSAVISYFRQHYIKTEIFDTKFSNMSGLLLKLEIIAIMKIFILFLVKMPKLNTTTPLNFTTR